MTSPVPDPVTKPPNPRAPVAFVFDCQYYIENHSDVKAKFKLANGNMDCGAAFQEYINGGFRTRRGIAVPEARGEFDCLEYIHRYPGIKPGYLMSDNKHYDCMKLREYYFNIGKKSLGHIASYVP